MLDLLRLRSLVKTIYKYDREFRKDYNDNAFIVRSKGYKPLEALDKNLAIEKYWQKRILLKRAGFYNSQDILKYALDKKYIEYKRLEQPRNDRVLVPTYKGKKLISMGYLGLIEVLWEEWPATAKLFLFALSAGIGVSFIHIAKELGKQVVSLF